MHRRFQERAKLAATSPCESRPRSIKESQAPSSSRRPSVSARPARGHALAVERRSYDLLIELRSVLHQRLEDVAALLLTSQLSPATVPRGAGGTIPAVDFQDASPRRKRTGRSSSPCLLACRRGLRIVMMSSHESCFADHLVGTRHSIPWTTRTLVRIGLPFTAAGS